MNETSKNRDYVADAFAQYVRYWKWFVAIIFSFAVLAVIYVKTQRPVYSLNASVVVKKEDQKASSMMASAMMKSFGVGMGSMLASESTEDEIEIFGSQNIIRKMVSSLGIYTAYELDKFPSNLSLYKNSPIEISTNPSFIDTLTNEFKFKVKVENDGVEVKVKGGKLDLGEFDLKNLPADIKTAYGTFHIQENKNVKMEKPYSLSITMNGLDPAAEKIKEKIDIGTITKKADVIALSIDDEIRQRGKDILNEIINQYNIDALSDKNKTALNTTQFLKIRIDSLYNELHVIETNIESYKRTNKFVDASAEVGLTLSKMSQLQEKNSTLDVQSAMIKAIEKQIKTGSRYELLPASIGLPENVASIVGKYNEVVLNRMRILRNSSEENPVIQTMDEQLKSLNKNLLASLQNAQKDIAISKDDSKQIESEISSRIDQMPRMERDYVDLKRQQELKSQIYLFLLQKMEETQLTKASSEPKAKVVDNAYSLTKPVKPKKIMLLFTALCLGFFVSVLVVGYKILTNKKVNTFRDVDSLADCEVLGIVKTNHVDELKNLRTNIIQQARQKDENTILISSIENIEAKSIVAGLLAESISKMGFKTLLIDLDWSNTSNRSSKKGISDYISDASVAETDLIDAVHTNFDKIAAGNASEAMEMFANGRIESLLHSFQGRYDMILLNTPSVQEVSDTLLLSDLSKINLYVVEIGKTPKASITRINQLSDTGNTYVVAYEA